MTLQDIMNLGNNSSMKFVVICSDGITAKGTYEEVMEFLSSEKEPQ